ncbi:MAG: sigma-54-dependent Fis family transcriptional regulator [Gemmatimonadota bacterium]|nr:MAG: sigma-54-dependent Fis family transcriptional regulator [Gemmatimonadota bacterium]
MSDAKERILVVDDSPDAREVLRRNLAAEGYEVITAPGVVEAVEILDTTSIDLVITDLKMPKVDGLDLIRHVRARFREVGMIMVTGYGSIETAVAAIKEGAENYLPKPFTDSELLSAVRDALQKVRFQRAALVQEATAPARSFGLIGESEAMRRVYRAMAKAVSVSATVLITGESGTGKELVARGIHYAGPRARAPFVPINCGGIPESLLESELFGHVKGAFTGATESRAGFFQIADGGTVFLDEISETSLAMQVKLLRVLQDGEIRMVGGTQQLNVDVRIIAATNKELLDLVRRQMFREDLYFRINVLNIDVPPLRERDDDVLLLAQHFVGKASEELGKEAPRFSDSVLEVLRRYHWPGNVRELENVIHRLVVMSEGESVDVPDLPSVMRFSVPRRVSRLCSLAEVESEHVRSVLEAVGGNKTRAAEILGIDRKTLREKLKRNLRPDEARE